MWIVWFSIVFFIVVMLVCWVMLREHKRYNAEIMEAFEFRERMSNAKFQSSVQRSLFLMGAHHGK